jgi:rhodanese-related sulfurtransferase
MSQVPPEVTPDEAARMLESDATITFVDVRSTAEYTNGHVPRSINVPLAQLDPGRGMAPNPDFLPVMQKLFRSDQCLILGCSAGGRSRHAILMLQGAGFSSLVNMAGGFAGAPGARGWQQLGLPVAQDGTTYADARKRAGM